MWQHISSNSTAPGKIPIYATLSFACFQRTEELSDRTGILNRIIKPGKSVTFVDKFFLDSIIITRLGLMMKLSEATPTPEATLVIAKTAHAIRICKLENPVIQRHDFWQVGFILTSKPKICPKSIHRSRRTFPRNRAPLTPLPLRQLHWQNVVKFLHLTGKHHSDIRILVAGGHLSH